MRPLLLLSLSLLLLGFVPLQGCAQERVTLALFDTSGSVDTDELYVRYAAIIERLIGGLGSGDRMLAGRITDRSDTEPLVLDEAMPASSLLDNRYRAADSLAAARRRAEAGASRLLDVPPSPCTDLLGAFDTAARVLAAHAGAERRLVVASDMVQTCAPLDLLSADLSDESMTAFIEAERSAGRLPDFAEVTVWVAGAGTEPRLSRERRAEVERFWAAYFAAAGADLSPSRYGPTLLGWQ